jgi:cold shock CspA family protein
MVIAASAFGLARLFSCCVLRNRSWVVAVFQNGECGRGYWYSEVVQFDKGFWVHSIGWRLFVHISAVEKVGLSSLNEGAKVSYEIISDRGKKSAGNLKVK